MQFDIRVSPEQVKQLGAWAKVGPGMADVELCADDRMLLAEQGDDRMAWDLDGSPGSDEYLERAPLDPAPHAFTTKDKILMVRKLLTELIDHAETGGSSSHTLDLVCDRWDEYEQEIGEAVMAAPTLT